MTPRAASIVSNKEELDRAGSADIKGGEAGDDNKGALNDALYHSREASREVGFEIMKTRIDGTRSESYLDSMNKADGLLHADAESIESAGQKDNSVHSGSIRSFPCDADNELTDSNGIGSGIDI
ncbi:unnamed protein product [Lymnaea stagnalis]|uniref:Uncharacterized protein n=1 Tax=Lymnaea stagnalis TaxID=6523 RepID=A0AAV2HJC6_LYMST